jgi:hypothetical protein
MFYRGNRRSIFRFTFILLNELGCHYRYFTELLAKFEYLHTKIQYKHVKVSRWFEDISRGKRGKREKRKKIATEKPYRKLFLFA